MWIDADGKNLDLVPVFLIEERFQLTQLSGAVWSPVSSVKDQHDMFFPSVIRECDSFTVMIFEREIGRFGSLFDAIQIGRRQVRPILRPWFDLSRNLELKV